jgi:uncharacterized membrane protein YkvA (DUF1232 family)
MEGMTKMTYEMQQSVPKFENRVVMVMWPIIKRTPTYIRLSLALVKHPAIPARHKLPLYGLLVYQVSPVHLAVTPIPVVGQIDCIVWLLLAIRQMIAHCPPAALHRCLLQSGLEQSQFDSDLAAIQKIGGSTRHRVGTDARFAGRVARFLAFRTVARMVVAGEKGN